MAITTNSSTSVNARVFGVRRRGDLAVQEWAVIPNAALLATQGSRLLNSEQCESSWRRVSVRRKQWHTDGGRGQVQLWAFDENPDANSDP
jgi:hypothetical protein